MCLATDNRSALLHNESAGCCQAHLSCLRHGLHDVPAPCVRIVASFEVEPLRVENSTNLSRWVREARSLPIMIDKPKPVRREWTVEQKARVLAAASRLDGEALRAYPRPPFADLASANGWVTRFVDWYNGAHRHSAIRYVTPDERHHGHERVVLTRRHELCLRARRANPERWSRSTRNWSPVGLVVLDPERAPDEAAASPARQLP